MKDTDDFVRTRTTGHWSDSNVDITGKRAPEPAAEESADEPESGE